MAPTKPLTSSNARRLSALISSGRWAGGGMPDLPSGRPVVTADGDESPPTGCGMATTGAVASHLVRRELRRGRNEEDPPARRGGPAREPLVLRRAPWPAVARRP